MKTVLNTFAGGLAAVLLGLGACSTRENAFESQAPDSLYEQAQLDMEEGSHGDYHAAQEKLEQFLSENPNHSKARALLAASLAAQSGIIIFNLAAETLSGEGGESPIEKLKRVLPEPTAENLALVRAAAEQMALIPRTEMTPEMIYAAGLYSMARGILLMKILTASVENLTHVTLEDAEEFVGSLLTAAEYFAGAQSDAVDSIREALSETVDASTESDGTVSVDRVKSYLDDFVS